MPRYTLSSVGTAACIIGLGIWFGLIDSRTSTPSRIKQTALYEQTKTPNSTIPPNAVPKARVLFTSDKIEIKDIAAGELHRITQLLTEKHFDDAVEMYSLLYNDLSESDSEPYREKIFAFAQALVEQEKYAEVIALLREYLDIFYQDLTALRMLAHSEHILQLYADEIETLFAALEAAYSIDDIASLRTRLDDAIAAQAVVLSNDPNAVLEFYQALVERKPEYESLQLGLSRALLRSGRKERAIVILNALPKESEHKHEIDELLVSARQNRFSDTSAVPMQRFGDNFSVKALINGVLSVTLLIDTGATLTIIHPHALQLSGINLQQSKKTISLNTANGVMTVPIFRLHSLSLGSQTVKDIEVGGVAINGLSGVNGLLGMNFLNKFKFTLDQRQQLILLAQ